MDRDREAQGVQSGQTSLGDWVTGWAQNHRTLSRVAAWCLGILAVAWMSTAGMHAVHNQWGQAVYFAATAAAAAFVCWWLSRQSSL